MGALYKKYGKSSRSDLRLGRKALFTYKSAALLHNKLFKRYSRRMEAHMLDTLEYTRVEGENKKHTIIVYALSTCGFCKRSLAFLDANKMEYSYIYMDKIPLETKNEAKRILKERFHQDIAFPFAVVDDKDTLVGFIEADWKQTLVA